MSPWRLSISSFIAWLRGPMELPSPRTSRVTPCRMSLCERPSSINDALAQHIMLMKPGATARPAASISVCPLALPSEPMAAIASPLIATSPTKPADPLPS